jgi:hypothetical protein
MASSSEVPLEWQLGGSVFTVRADRSR